MAENATRRKEQICSFCGKTGCYAEGLCRTCYMRKWRNGTPEYKDRHGSRPHMWSEKTEKILELYKGGMRQTEIAREVGVTRQAVSIAIKKHWKPNNADRIRSMTDEELAEFMCHNVSNGTVNCAFCGAAEFCRMGHIGWLDWLKEEAAQ